MRKHGKHLGGAILSIVFFLSTALGWGTAKALETEKQSIFLASDAVAQSFDETAAPQQGWGQALALYFSDLLKEGRDPDASYEEAALSETENVVIRNRSAGKETARSFIEEGKLAEITAELSAGDLLMLQWGRQEAEAGGPESEAAAEEFSAWIQQYIDAAEEKSAQAVLLTPFASYNYDAENARFKEDDRSYADVLRKVAAEESLPLLDLEKASLDLLNEAGEEAGKSYFLFSETGTSDKGLLNQKGAEVFAGLAAEALLALPDQWPAVNSAKAKITMPEVSEENNEARESETEDPLREAEEATGVSEEDSENTANDIDPDEPGEDESLRTGETALWRFDFNHNDSPTEEGYIGVNPDELYSEEKGYGWSESPGNGRDRAGSQEEGKVFNSMESDFALGAGTFSLDLPNGDYEITVYSGDIMDGTSTNKTPFEAEGKPIGTVSARRSAESLSAEVRVEDGRLDVFADGYFNGLEVRPILLAPADISYENLSFDETGAHFLLTLEKSEDAASYTLYGKQENDEDFAPVKGFTAEELEADDAGCRSITAPVGTTMQYYLTQTNAGGVESVKSNILEIVMIDEDTEVLPAPSGLKVDSAEMGRISLSWDASEGALRYVIYRSDKSEKDPNFTDYVKVGESTEASFEDMDEDLTTNVPYYYKVSAVNAGGESEKSPEAASPVTGSLIAAPAETLRDRALTAINLAGDKGASIKEGAETGVFLSWRRFPGETGESFTLYKNGSVLLSGYENTNYVDEAGTASDRYEVRGTADAALGLQSKTVAAWQNHYMDFALERPAPVSLPDGNTVSFVPNDLSVGDLDGDGSLELVVKWSSNDKDNSHSGYTGPVYIDGYDIDFNTGETALLWRINLGVNIRAGAHYTQFQVWDYNGDGKAEIMMKTADGSTTYRSADGTQNSLTKTGHVGAVSAEELPFERISDEHDYRNDAGYVLDGPEYLTVFSGEDGRILDTVDYVPARGNVDAWGDGYGNRVDRFLAATAYLDGRSPSAIFSRGYYTRTVIAAYGMIDTDNDGIGDTLQLQWAWDTDIVSDDYPSVPVTGQGNHNLVIADVDGDGKDEIVFGSITIDHDGTLKYSTGLGHGDAMHVSDFDLDNPGLEVMQVHEDRSAAYGVEIHDAETGTILHGYFTGNDTGRGAAGDIDPTARGAEFWATDKPAGAQEGDGAWDSAKGAVYSTDASLGELRMLSPVNPAANFILYWDGDLLSEIQDHSFNNAQYVPLTTKITKWDYLQNKEITIFESDEILTNNGTKGNMGLVADVIGDWRDEIIGRTPDGSGLRIYSTTYESPYSIPTGLKERQYREAVAWQNTAYNQPAHRSELLSAGLITSELSVTDEDRTAESITVHYTEASDGVKGLPVTGYVLYRADASEEADFVEIARIDGKEAGSYTDEGLAPDSSYRYQIRALLNNAKAVGTQKDTLEGHRSRILETSTTPDILEVLPLEKQTLIQDTPLEEGQSPADLLPQTAAVINKDGEEAEADLSYDLSGFDLSTPGSYQVKVTVDGWPETLNMEVEVLENIPLGFLPVADQYVLLGTDGDLPETVKVHYKNGTEVDTAVVWDDFPTDEVRDFAGNDAIAGTTEVDEALGERVRVNVYVKEDYIESVKLPEHFEAALGGDGSSLPDTVDVVYASGAESTAEITSWNLEDADFRSLGEYPISATVEGYGEAVPATLHIRYPSVFKFDFGIEAGRSEAGWTEVVVNPKGGSTPISEFGSVYTEEQGWGFLEDGDMQGRSESYSDEGLLPETVYTDFALPAGNTFRVDLPDGRYEVEVFSGSYYKSSVKGNIQDEVAVNVSNAGEKYESKVYELDIEGGYLSFEFDSSNVTRIPALIIREVIDELPPEPTVPSETTTEDVEPTAPSETTTEDVEPTAPSETTTEDVEPTAPSETTTEDVKPTEPSETTTEDVEATDPSETTKEDVEPTVPAETTEDETQPSDSDSTAPAEESTDAAEQSAKTDPAQTDEPDGTSAKTGEKPLVLLLTMICFGAAVVLIILRRRFYGDES